MRFLLHESRFFFNALQFFTRCDKLAANQRLAQLSGLLTLLAALNG